VVFPDLTSIHDASARTSTEAIMEKQAELAGPLASHLEGKLTAIRGIADRILVSGELAEDSHVLAEVREIIWLSSFYVDENSYQRRGGGRVATQ
jgi:hypothetical protein